ncbi:hypothetical protein HWV62_11540 [Athelia sp. TMB]|nr:hypothetical protein HWV62_11540 [Athelia sp. TMB]
MTAEKFIDHHIQGFPITTISVLSPYTGLILAVVLCVLFLVRFYVLELFLLQRLYGIKYTCLNEIDRRGFVNHHIAGATKIIILITAVYPFLSVAFGHSGFHDPFVKGSIVTMGDILVICSQMLVGMFIFELTYRVKISPVSVVHHLGSILVAQAAITISIEEQRDSSIEFVLCTVWGAFDMVCEFLPHVAIILYRVYPDSHHFLASLFRTACLTTFIGTISETIVTMYLFGQLWHRWELSFKIATPILHIAFSAAQFHGTRIFFAMWKKQERLIREAADLEKGQDKVISSAHDSEESERGVGSMEEVHA